jgi:hypothetical protein
LGEEGTVQPNEEGGDDDAMEEPVEKKDEEGVGVTMGEIMVIQMRMHVWEMGCVYRRRGGTGEGKNAAS